MRILLVEDDCLLGESMCAALKLDGHAIDWVKTGESALHALDMPESHDILLLDLGLPHLSGLDVLKEIRQQQNNILTIILTARDSQPDKIEGLDSGADDYLTKPIDIDELTARIRSVCRRAKGRANGEISLGDITLNPACHEVQSQGTSIELTRKEFTILQELVEAGGRAVSKPRLEQALYAWGEDVESNTIEVYICRLRKKLGKGLIQTLRGIGYKLALLQ